MTICPGKRGHSQYGSNWDRDLIADLDAIRKWDASVLLTLMEFDELTRLGVTGLDTAAIKAGLHWLHIPITDGAVPDHRFENAWPGLAPNLVRHLAAGNRIVVHCRGGLGRTGLVTSLLLVEFGYEPSAAMDEVRVARPGTVETRQQEEYVLSYKRLA